MGDTMREAFEKWVSVERPSLLKHTITYPDMVYIEAGAIAWDVWQAAHEVGRQLGIEQARRSQPTLTVWFGSMPESNGKRNWTVLLRRKDASGLRGDISNGYCVCRSEYYDQMRYAADRMRFLIGERAEAPSILDYPGDTKEPPTPPAGDSDTP